MLSNAPHSNVNLGNLDNSTGTKPFISTQVPWKLYNTEEYLFGKDIWYEGEMVNDALISPTLCNTPWIQKLYWCAKEQQQQPLWWWAIKYLPAAAVC